MQQLFPDSYLELHNIAHAYLKRERSTPTLSPTVLVHEAYIKLANQKEVEWKDRGQFLGFAAHCMRQILVDYVRKQDTKKRGAGYLKITLAPESGYSSQQVDLIRLDDVLNELEKADPEKCKLVELRFFCGLTIEETARVMNSSPATIKRLWRFTKAWLHDQLS